jgi:hypothetical protein
MVAQRARRRWLAGLRQPKAQRAPVLISRLIPSEAAFVTPVVIAARICGHQVDTVVARRSISGRPLAAAFS